MGGSYYEYKSCTITFIHWINCASAIVSKDSVALPNTLTSIKRRTHIITEFPQNAIGNDLRTCFQTAMLAGFRAIQLRKYVHSLNAAFHSDGNEGHLHCIKVLKSCYAMLNNWKKLEDASQECTLTVPVSTQMHIDSLLKDVPTTGVENEDDIILSTSEEQFASAQTVEEIDETLGDCKIAGLCLLHDMLTADAQLVELLKDVKIEKKSILTAVAAIMVTYRQICQSYATVQSIYPSIVTLDDFFARSFNMEITPTLLESFTSHFDMMRCLFSVRDPLRFMSGIFQNEIGKKKRTPLIIPPDTTSNLLFVENDLTPPLGKDIGDYMRFLHVEIPRLYNDYFAIGGENDNRKSLQYCNPLTQEFHDAFVPYFEQGRITLPFVFLIHCWFQSIVLLQDAERRCLGRNLYCLRQLGHQIDESMKQFDAFVVENEQHLFQSPTTTTTWSAIIQSEDLLLLYHNPILQGCVVLDKLMNYVHFSSQLLLSSSLHQVICRSYLVLKHEQCLIEEIPILEELLQYSSSVAATPPLTSILYQVLHGNHLTILVPSSSEKAEGQKENEEEKVITNEEILQRMIVQMEKELFVSRGLSLRTTFVLSELFKFCQSLRSSITLHHIIPIDDVVTTGLGKVLAANEVSDHLVSFIEALIKPIEIAVSTAAAAASNCSIEEEHHSKQRLFLAFLAKEMQAWFVTRYETIEKDSLFHFFSSTPTWVTEAFGNITHSMAKNMSVQNQTAMNSLFVYLMQTLYQLDQRLSIAVNLELKGGKQGLLQEIRISWEYKMKSDLKAFPALAMIQMNEEDQKDDDGLLYDNLLDYAIAGMWSTCFGTDLAEWIIQMWGYHYVNTSASFSYKVMQQTQKTHLQIACLARRAWALPLLISENEGQEMNFQCMKDGNTALHYAILVEDEAMAIWLVNTIFPNMQIRNHFGFTARELISRMRQGNNNTFHKLSKAIEVAIVRNRWTMEKMEKTMAHMRKDLKELAKSLPQDLLKMLGVENDPAYQKGANMLTQALIAGLDQKKGNIMKEGEGKEKDDALIVESNKTSEKNKSHDHKKKKRNNKK